jgi:hypothetical protein
MGYLDRLGCGQPRNVLLRLDYLLWSIVVGNRFVLSTGQLAKLRRDEMESLAKICADATRPLAQSLAGAMGGRLHLAAGDTGGAIVQIVLPLAATG